MTSEATGSINIVASREKGSPNEDKAIENEGLNESRILLKDNVLKRGTVNEDARDMITGGLQQGQSVVQEQQQQQQQQQQLRLQRPVVCWERLLSKRSIQVLLVENDDSTRHVVTALLRKCNYEALEAANGLQAWKILEDSTKHIDLVLTEVVLPSVSGIDLLCKIMSHKTRKNVPVIMMSSHDSMGLVVKCLSKGAVDFLVKPIRKNELKNIWRHVWRKSQSSSESGSESGIQTRKAVKSNDMVKFDNSGSKAGANNWNKSLEVGDGSEDEGDAQSSWTKPAAEVDCSQAMSPIGQLADYPDSTCAQGICSNAETAGNKMGQMSVARKEQKEKHDIAAEGKCSETVIPRNSKSQSENPNGVSLNLQGAKQKTLLDMHCNKISNQSVKQQSKISGKCQFGKHEDVTANVSNPEVDPRVSESTREMANILDMGNDATDESKEPNLELSLKRIRVQDIGRPVQGKSYLLRPSEQSSLTRYASSNVFKTSTVITGSNSVVDYSVEHAKRGTFVDIQAHSVDHLLLQSSKGISNYIDMGSETNKFYSCSSIMKDKSAVTSTSNPSAALRPVNNDLRYNQQQVNTEDIAASRDLHPDGFYPHHHHHHHHYHHHHHCHDFHNVEQQPSCNHDVLSLKKLTAYASLFGSSNVFGGIVEANPKNYSLNISASGSNHGINGQNGNNNTVVNAVGTNAESDLEQTVKSGSGDAIGKHSGNRRDQNKLTLQKTVFSKICQKRKER